MKRLFTLFFALFLSHFSFAQFAEFPTPGFECVDVFWSDTDIPFALYGDGSFVYDDTIQECGNIYHLFKTVNGVPYFSLRIDNGKYYRLITTEPCEEVLFYDFSLEVGDTFAMPEFNWLYWDYDTATVIETGTYTLLNGEERRRVILQSKFSQWFEYDWVDGIGDIENGFFRDISDISDEQIVCVRDKSGWLYDDSNSWVWVEVNCDSTLCPDPFAQFEAICIENSLTFDFQNLSQRSAEYNWDFGDGNTSTEENPGIYEYENPGCYRVELTSSADCWEKKDDRIRYINAGLPNPWQPAFETNFGIAEVQFLTNEIGYIRNGKELYKTENGGIGWSVIPLPDEPFPDERYIANIDFLNEQVGIMGLRYVENQIYWTWNGGITWEKSLDLDNGHFYDIAVASDSTAYVSERYNNLYKTNDSGQTWNEILDFNFHEIKEIIPFGEDTLYMLGNWGIGPGWAPCIFTRTYDGVNFEEIILSKTEFPDMHFTDYPTCAFFLNKQKGWFGTSNGLIFHTHDGGDSWTQQYNGDFLINDIKFISENHGLAIGRYGFIAETFDGGENWELNYCNIDYDRYYQGLDWIAPNRPLIVEWNDSTSHLLTLSDIPKIEYCEFPSDTDDFETEFNFDIYPNPSSGIFHLELKESAQKVHNILIFNYLGQKISESKINSVSETVVDLSNRASGIYFVQILNKNEILGVRKLILE